MLIVVFGHSFEDLPDNAIKENHPKDIPVTRDPTPYNCISIYGLTLLGGNKKKRQRRNEGQAVTCEQISYIESTKLLNSIAAEKDEINIARHEERPVHINPQEPTYVSILFKAPPDPLRTSEPRRLGIDTTANRLQPRDRPLISEPRWWTPSFPMMRRISCD